MRTGLRRFTGFIFIGSVIVGFCLGCAGVEQKFDDWQSSLRQKLNFKSAGDGDSKGRNGDEGYFVHTCQWSGETLDGVAQWYTGDSKNTGKLADLNPYINPDKIPVGGQVVIPVGMLKTRQPLPKSFSKVYRRDYYRHTVRWPGESLSLIASWYTGSSKNWRKLAKANPGLNPNRIKGGNVIVIPSFLLKTRVPLPQKVAAKYTTDYFAYKVKEDNEKLTDIARWYTGNSANRNRLAQANPDLDPDRLVRGNEVYIPKKLLKSRHSIQFPAPTVSLTKAAANLPAGENEPTSKPKPAPETDKNIKLFGPKQFPKQ
jgi:hypothetical protein